MIQPSRQNFFDLVGSYRTISLTGELANVTAAAPRNIYEQVFIDTSTATKKLYIYDFVGKTWLSVTIS